MLMLTVVFGVTVDANVNSSFLVAVLMLMLTVIFSANVGANVNSGFQCQC